MFKKLLKSTIVSFVFAASLLVSVEAKAQGYPNFDIAETASEITNLISDIVKVVQKPFELLSVKDKIAVLGELGASMGDKFLGPIQGKLKDGLAKVQMKQDNLTKVAAGSVSEAQESIKDTYYLPPEEAKNTHRINEVRQARQEAKNTAAVEGYALALAQKDRIATTLDDRIKKVEDTVSSAEDKRASISANTTAVIELCTEMMSLVNIQVAELKMMVVGEMNLLPTVATE